MCLVRRCDVGGVDNNIVCVPHRYKWDTPLSLFIQSIAVEMRSLFTLLSLALTAVAVPYHGAIVPRAPSGAPTVHLKNGSYYGVHSSTYNQDFFLGIPFAQPPLGDLRFSNPESYNASWDGALPATNYAFVRLSTWACGRH